MKININCLLLIINVFYFSCRPTVRSTVYKKLPSSISTVTVFEKKDFLPPKSQLIGIVDVMENGLSINCGYEEALELTKKEAQKNGGNAIQIIKHFFPDPTSTCHRLESKVYFIDNIANYEPRFSWSEKRKLNWNDFKSKYKPDFSEDYSAAIHTTIRYNINVVNSFGKLEIKVYNTFECNKSWVDSLKKDSILLKHEQTHFDICELYTRRFKQEIANYTFNYLPTPYFNFNNLKELEKINKKIIKEYNEVEASYDEETEHGTKIEIQKKWDEYVHYQLDELKKFEF
jgi:hypothetical protein